GKQPVTLFQHLLSVGASSDATLMATKGYTALEVEHAYTRARALCQQLGETSQLSPVLQGLFMVSAVRADFQAAHRLAEQLLGLAQHGQEVPHLFEAHVALGFTLYFLGELVPARTHIEQALVLYDPQQYRSPTTWVQGPFYRAWVLWHLGYPDQAVERLR